MPGVICRRILIALAAMTAIGCQQPQLASAPAAPGAPAVTAVDAQQIAMLQRQQELTQRTSTLDLDNQELQVKLAQVQQQNHLLSDQLQVTREQLNSTTQQLASARESQKSVEEQSQALAASMKKRSAAMISANSSLSRNLPVINIPGVEVRQDGDVVRIELPADKLFNPNTAQIRSDAQTMLNAAVAELQRAYPKQIIGIEGHTDADPPAAGTWQSNHQLSTARAGAVLDYLTQRAGMNPQQLFLVGHGGNHPVASNASQAGKARNRRVELVVYPEEWQR